MATFITSQAVGEFIGITVQTTTEYCKYNHDGVDSNIFNHNGGQWVEVLNANGEFTIISCDEFGTPSGDITFLDLNNNQITSFDGTGLSALTELYLSNNQLTQFDGTDLSALSYLDLGFNPLTSFVGGDLSLNTLNFSDSGWNITTLDSIDISNMSNLFSLDIRGNNLINIPTVNNYILTKLASNEAANDSNFGEFFTSGGRTAAGTADYDYLIANSWSITGADLVPTVTGKLRVKGVGQIVVGPPRGDGGGGRGGL